MVGLIKIIIFSIILSALIYPGFEKLYLYKQTNELEDIVMGPLAFLGENQTILSNDDKFTRYGTKYKSLDLLPNRDLFIGIKNEFLPYAKWVNIDEERVRVFRERFESLADTSGKLNSGNYSAVIYGPFEYELDIFTIIVMPKLFTGVSTLDSYCEIFLPTVEHKCNECMNTVRAFVKDSGSCLDFRSAVAGYYKKSFREMCKYDKTFANVHVRNNLMADGFALFPTCKDGGSLLTKYSDKSFRLDDLANIIYASLIILTVIVLSRRKFKPGLVLLGILILAIMPLVKFDSSYHPDYYTNRSANIEAQFNYYSSVINNMIAYANITLHEDVTDYERPVEIVYVAPFGYISYYRYGFIGPIAASFIMALNNSSPIPEGI